MTKTIKQLAIEYGAFLLKDEISHELVIEVANLEAMCKAYHAQQCEGWQLVPIEPTEEMIKVAFNIIEIKPFGNFKTGNDVRREIYKAMLASAPKKGE